MSGGGGQTVNSDPWEGQQPYLSDIFSEAQSIYESGTGTNYYPGTTVAPFSGQTEAGLDALFARSQGGSPVTQGLADYSLGGMSQQNIDPQAMMAGGMQAMSGLPAGQNLMMAAGQPLDLGALTQNFGYGNSLQGYGDAASMTGGPVGSVDPSANFVSSALAGDPSFSQTAGMLTSQFGLGGQVDPGQLTTDFNLSGGQLDPAAASQLSTTASGDFLGSNPYLDSVFGTGQRELNEQFQQTVMPELNATFGAAGRSGGGLHQLYAGQAAGDLQDATGDLFGSIYAPAYESERNRQMQAAGQLGSLGLQQGAQDLQAQSTGAQLMSSAEQSQQQADLTAQQLAQQGGVAGLGIASDIYGMNLGQQLGAAQLGGDLYNLQNQANLGYGQLGTELFGAAQQGDLSRLGMAADLYGGGLDRSLAAGAGLGELGISGMNAMGDLYGDIGSNQYRAATMAPQVAELEYGDIEQTLRGGALLEDQTQRLMSDAQTRYDFNQQAPWQQIGNYSSAIYGMPSGYGTQTSSGGSRVAGALGGAMAGGGIASMLGGGSAASAAGMMNPYLMPMIIGGGLLGMY